jgi:hypothetical protein
MMARAVRPSRPPRPRLLLLAAAALALAVVAPAAAQVPAPADRPMGTVSTWSHELNQNELPSWRRATAPPIRPGRWYRIVDGILAESGRSGLWFSGPSALPFPPLPLSPKEPVGWRTPARFARAYRNTGLSWDVALEVWAARRALDRGALVVDPRVERTAYTRRLSLLDPAYERAAAREIRRLVPGLRNRPYVNFYTGSDEPIVLLPRGRAERSAYARRLRREVRREFGLAPPRAAARPTRSVQEGLRWLAYSRYVSDRLFDLKARQARLIRRLDRDAVVSPNDFGFIDGFPPWDYTRLAGFADVVEADPYVSYAERDRTGRGRYNPGFAAKLLSDLTGRRTRILIQAFPYSGYRPVPGDLYAWSAQALRAGASDLSFFASQNPRFTDRRLYRAMLAIARGLRGTRLPAPPTDPAQLVLYATASEGQAQPHRTGGARYRTSGDELYTTYAALGELARAAFSFTADTRLDAARLAGARTVWLPRADTLDADVAQALAAWVRGGGTLVVTDPDAFARTPAGAPLDALRAELIGAPAGAPRPDRALRVEAGALGPGIPARALAVPLAENAARAFSAVPAGAGVVARLPDGAPAALARTVGAGRVVAFASEVMSPAALAAPGDLPDLAAALHAAAGGTLGHPAWGYRVPGDPRPNRPPWRDS